MVLILILTNIGSVCTELLNLKVQKYECAIC